MLLPLPISASVALLVCALSGVAGSPSRPGDQVAIDPFPSILNTVPVPLHKNRSRRGPRVKRTACTSTSQCGDTPLLANQMAICSSRVCTAFCVAGYYLDTTTKACKAYVCDMGKCTNVLPAHSTRICISTTTCGFRCLRGYTWTNRQCVSVNAKTTANAAAATTSSIRPTSTLSSTKLSSALTSTKPTSTLTTSKLSSSSTSTKSFSTVTSTKPTSSLTSTRLTSTLSTASPTTTTLPLSSTASTVTSSTTTSAPTELPTTTLSFAPSVVLTNGTLGMVTGNINALLKWQSSGYLASGVCGNLLPGIVSCYRYYLNSTGMLESPLPSTTTLTSTATSIVTSTTTVVSTTTSAARTTAIRARSEWSQDGDPWRDDDNLELYYATFPEHHSGLMKRACVVASSSTSTSLTSTSASSTATRTSTTASLVRRATVNLTTTISTTSTLTTRPIASTTTSTAVPTATYVETSRQRVEILSWPGGAAGTSWTYTWTTYLTPGVVLSNKFFHMWQILSRDPCLSGPIMTLSLSSGRVFVSDLVPGRCGGTTGIPCPSMTLTSFWGRPISHEMNITYGPSGNLSYQAVDARAPEVALLSYNATGQVGSAGSIKFGLYRSAVAQNPMSEVESFVGGYKAVQVL